MASRSAVYGGHCIQCIPRTGADDYIGSTEAANPAPRQCGFQGLWADEASGPENQFCRPSIPESSLRSDYQPVDL
jgi:hypothetical protein